MEEDQLIKMGITKYGDRVAILACAKAKSHNNSKTKDIIDRLNSKLCSGSKGLNNLKAKLTGNKNAKKQKRKIEIGRLNQQGNGELKQVKQKSGGGTRSISEDIETTVATIMSKAIELFFPNDVSSSAGSVELYHLSMAKFDHSPIDESKTLEQLYKETGLKLLRLYLCTKPKDMYKGLTSDDETDTNSKEDAISEIPNSASKKLRLCVPQTIDNVESTDSSVITSTPKHSQPPKTDNPLFTEEDLEAFLHDDSNSINPEEFADLIQFNSSTQADTTVSVNDIADAEILFGRNEDAPTLSDTIESWMLCIQVHRGNALHELEEFFQQNDIDSMRGTEVEVKMRLPNGKAEAGEGEGVMRDVLAEYWAAFYDHRCEGNVVKVPSLSPKMGAREWRAVSNILAVGYYLHQYLPAQLSPSFLSFAMSGDEKRKEDLIDEYIKFLNNEEGNLIRDALRDFKSVDADELIEFFDERGHCKLPTAENIRSLVSDVAHKDLIQRPAYIAECGREKLRMISPMLKESGLKDMLQQMTPNFKNIWSCIKFDDSAPQALKSQLKKYIKDLDVTMLGLFLRFCTGSDVYLGKEIKVSFVEPCSEFARVPTAHTCACMLSLPDNYSTVNELRSEFNTLLKSNVWVMDVV